MKTSIKTSSLARSINYQIVHYNNKIGSGKDSSKLFIKKSLTQDKYNSNYFKLSLQTTTRFIISKFYRLKIKTISQRHNVEVMKNAEV